MHPNEHHNSMSRVFDFVENGIAETENRSAPLEGRSGKKIPESRRRDAVRDILKQDFGQPNEDRLYGKLAPMKPPC